MLIYKYYHNYGHIMTKTILLAIFTVSILLTGTIAGPIGMIQSVDALKSK